MSPLARRPAAAAPSPRPPPPRPQELADLLRRLLVRRPALRLGARAGGADDVKRHAWFAGFDWAAFEARSMAPPYLPKVGASPPPVDCTRAGLVQRAWRCRAQSACGGAA